MRCHFLRFYMILVMGTQMIVSLRCAMDSRGLTIDAADIASWVTVRDHTAVTDVAITLEKDQRTVDGRDDVTIVITYSEAIESGSVTNSQFEIVGVDQNSTSISIPTWTLSFPSASSIKVTFATNLPAPGVYRMRIRGVRTSSGRILSEENSERTLIRLQGDLNFNGISMQAQDNTVFTNLIIEGGTVAGSQAKALGDANYSGSVTVGDIGAFTAYAAYDLSTVAAPSF